MPRPHDPANPAAGWVYRFAAFVAFGVMKLQRWRVRIDGLDHLPRRGGAVIAANHTSYWDFFTMGWGPYLGWGRPIRILAKESLFRAPAFGFVMRRARHIPVHRGGGAHALHDAVSALREGELVLVLPERTISWTFELLPFRTGAARMAASAGVPLIPAVSWGSHRFHTKGRRPRWSWRLPVLVRYGEPMHPTPEDDPVEVTAALRRGVQELLDTVWEEYPDGQPSGAWWVPARVGGGAPAADTMAADVRRLEESWRQPVRPSRARSRRRVRRR